MRPTQPGLKTLLGWIIAAGVVFDAHPALAQGTCPHLYAPNPARTITVIGGTLSEPILEVNPGEKVTWLVLGQPVTIAFQEEGTSVFLTCASSTHLEFGEDETYLSGVIPPGGTASLCFIEPGMYNYVVFIRGGLGGQIGPPAGVPQGTIVVR